MQQPNSRPMMSLPEAIAQCLRRYAGFSGRATRAEYWWWELATTACIIILGVLAFLLPDAAGTLSVVESLFVLAILLPTWTVTVRRLHDIGKSGWWILTWMILGSVSGIIMVVGAVLAFGLAFLGDLLGEGGLTAIGYVVLIVGLVPHVAIWLWVIVWMARQGDDGANRHGPDPRAV